MEKLLVLHQLIETNMAEIKRLRELAIALPAVDPSKEHVKGGPLVQSKFANIIEKLVDLEKDLYAEIEEYVDYEKEMLEVIAKMPPEQGLVLKYFYIEKLPVEYIARKLGVTVRHVYNLKSAALKESEKFH
jgi:DNA-directed RNA polymerase specialized sigma24 family protein